MAAISFAFAARISLTMPTPVFPEHGIAPSVSIPITSSICFFVFSKSEAGRSTLFKMVKHFVKLKNEHGLHSAFCRVEKVNKHYDKLVRMYKRLGFYEVHSDDQASYYKWV